MRVTQNKTIEQLKAQIAQKTAERTEPDRQRIVLMPTASETAAGGKAVRLEIQGDTFDWQFHPTSPRLRSEDIIDDGLERRCFG